MVSGISGADIIQKSNFVKNSTMQPTIHYIRKELQSVCSPEETESMVRLIFRHLKNFTLTDLVLKKEETLSPEEKEIVVEITRRLKNSEPLQYILGTTEFFGLTLKVNPDVLIPRPETEELIGWILESGQLFENILDIGTGSGCIALALKHHLKDSSVYACDISRKALETARKNAMLNNLDITFIQADILKDKELQITVKPDLIVSNPPYVRESEKQFMADNVTRFEPGIALFVNDEQPLVFYEAIAKFAKESGANGGWLYLEINESLGPEMVALLSSMDFGFVEIRKDLQGKDRMIRARI